MDHECGKSGFGHDPRDICPACEKYRLIEEEGMSAEDAEHHAERAYIDQQHISPAIPTKVEIIMPHGALGSDSPLADMLEAGLRCIAYLASDPATEWAVKYGTNFANETFHMATYRECVECEGETCEHCGRGSPNFYYAPLDFEVRWYKYIGRDMEFNKEIPASGVAKMIHDCLESISWSRIKLALES